jgi:hypothetical protein
MSTLNNGVMIAIGNDKSTDTPSAWIGCLGCYNAGRLIGKWIPGLECDDLEAAGLTDSAGRCTRCGADEFLAMDHEHFLGLLDGGEPNPQECYEAALQLAEVQEYEREILAAWIGNGMDFDLDAMRDSYIGEYEGDREFAESLVNENGLLESIPENLQNYFDYDAYARDLMYDAWEYSGHYFWNR